MNAIQGVTGDLRQGFLYIVLTCYPHLQALACPLPLTVLGGNALDALFPPLFELLRLRVSAHGERGVQVVEGVGEEADAQQGRRPVGQRQAVQLGTIRT